MTEVKASERQKETANFLIRHTPLLHYPGQRINVSMVNGLIGFYKYPEPILVNIMGILRIRAIGPEEPNVMASITLGHRVHKNGHVEHEHGTYECVDSVGCCHASIINKERKECWVIDLQETTHPDLYQILSFARYQMTEGYGKLADRISTVDRRGLCVQRQLYDGPEYHSILDLD
jgi:hypothetical protein